MKRMLSLAAAALIAAFAGTLAAGAMDLVHFALHGFRVSFVVQLAVAKQLGSKPPTRTVAVMLSKPSAPVAVTSISRLF